MRALLPLAPLVLAANALASGRIQAVVTEGVLDVAGDHEANVLRIAAASEPGAMIVSGLGSRAAPIATTSSSAASRASVIG